MSKTLPQGFGHLSAKAGVRVVRSGGAVWPTATAESRELIADSDVFGCQRTGERREVRAGYERRLVPRWSISLFMALLYG